MEWEFGIYVNGLLKGTSTIQSIQSCFQVSNNIVILTFTMPDKDFEYIAIGVQMKEILNATIGVGWVKLEYGECATPFMPLSYQEELARCQKYYYKPPNSSSWVSCQNLLGGGIYYTDSYLPNMRVIPTLRFESGASQIFTNNGWVNLTHNSTTEYSIIFDASSLPISQGQSYLMRNLPSYDAEFY